MSELDHMFDSSELTGQNKKEIKEEQREIPEVSSKLQELRGQIDNLEKQIYEKEETLKKLPNRLKRKTGKSPYWKKNEKEKAQEEFKELEKSIKCKIQEIQEECKRLENEGLASQIEENEPSGSDLGADSVEQTANTPSSHSSFEDIGCNSESELIIAQNPKIQQDGSGTESGTTDATESVSVEQTLFSFDKDESNPVNALLSKIMLRAQNKELYNIFQVFYSSCPEKTSIFKNWKEYLKNVRDQNDLSNLKRDMACISKHRSDLHDTSAQILDEAAGLLRERQEHLDAIQIIAGLTDSIHKNVTKLTQLTQEKPLDANQNKKDAQIRAGLAELTDSIQKKVTKLRQLTQEKPLDANRNRNTADSTTPGSGGVTNPNGPSGGISVNKKYAIVMVMGAMFTGIAFYFKMPKLGVVIALATVVGVYFYDNNIKSGPGDGKGPQPENIKLKPPTQLNATQQESISTKEKSKEKS